ncbi:MAG: BspA family leucine-rich repeat surface protein [Bacteroidota bacterium]
MANINYLYLKPYNYIANEPSSSAGNTYGRPIGTWCVGAVTNMSELFRQKSTFNEPLNNWDVSSVTDMSSMFSGFPPQPTSFNQDLCAWGQRIDASANVDSMSDKK